MIGGLVCRVLHHGHAEQDVLARKNEFRGLRQQFAKHVHAVGVQGGGADDLAHADGQHFDDARFDGRAKVGVRLDARNHDDRIGFGSMLVHVNRHAVVELA